MSDDIKYTDVDEIEKELPVEEEDEEEYEEVCMMCHRPESRAGRMVHMPGKVCICDDCMHRTMEMVSDMQQNGVLDSPEFQRQMAEIERQMFALPESSDEPKEEKPADEKKDGENKGLPKGFPQIRFINMADLQGIGMPEKQKLKKKKKSDVPPIQLKDIPAPH